MLLPIWTTFAFAYLLTTLSPGPNVLLTVRNSLQYGSRSALATIFGNLTSQLLIVLLVAGGVGAVIAAMPQVFVAMKLCGAAYLIFLGIRQLRDARKAAPIAGAPVAPAAPVPLWRIYREAVLVSATNPKALIFLSAFMPQFVDHEAALAPQFAIMYATIAVTVVCVHIVYAQSARGLRTRLSNRKLLLAIKHAGGGLFVLLGLKLLTSKHA
ncbi:MAG TPA: LysE family translocator [Burkholderiaceae bacterium]